MATNPSSTEDNSQPSTAAESTRPGTPDPVPLRSFADISDEEGPWSQKTVISFDGGGIRGYSSLLIVKSIMLKIRAMETGHKDGPMYASSDYPWMDNEHREPPTAEGSLDGVGKFLPCHYFDYMAGTSTGGLTSIMLGRLRMTVDEALEQYVRFGDAVFGKPRWFNSRPINLLRPKFSSKQTEVAFQDIISDRLEQVGGDTSPQEAQGLQFKSSKHRTRTLVLSYGLGAAERTYIWRSYDWHQAFAKPQDWEPFNPGPASRMPIWRVARATTAAPTYFKPIELGNQSHVDGGIQYNNPAIPALWEVIDMHNKNPALFVSIGTGIGMVDNGNSPNGGGRAGRRDTSQSNSVARKKGHLEIINVSKRRLTDTEGETGYNGWRRECSRHQMDNGTYIRLNVGGDLHKVPLDDWRPSEGGDKTLGQIRAKTNEYLMQPSVQALIASIADKLVSIRRQRMLTERWESFAVEVEYHCKICLDKGGVSRWKYNDRAGLRCHLEGSSEHTANRGGDDRPMTAEELKKALDDGRTTKPGNVDGR